MFKAYRFLGVELLRPLLGPKIFKRPEERDQVFKTNVPEKKTTRIWFHAASVGELEMMMPVIQAWRGESVVTIFSESAEKNLELLRRIPSVVFAGFSPWEGKWNDALGTVDPDLFVSARYEAWPDLWYSLGELGIPLVVVGAQSRTSLKIAKTVVELFHGMLPRLYFLTIDDADIAKLKNDFPTSNVRTAGDPRWERVIQRAGKGNPRAIELIDALSKAPRPWGVLGSVWVDEIESIKTDTQGLLKKAGLLWIVPHQIDAENIAQFEKSLKGWGVSFARSSSLKGQPLSVPPQCILVDEMGFLSELYAYADWAYVGGGFGKGVHNTIEPAIHGIPIACGPKGSQRFPEIDFLAKGQQLRVLSSAQALGRWMMGVQSIPVEKKEIWKKRIATQMGASKRILTSFEDVLALRSKS
jgi:3-deoxy-D-manno-octulosonic-acid transferase